MAKEISNAPITVYSILAPGTKIKGDISSDTDLRLDGTMEGNIVSDGKVILGPSSSLIGNITCSNAEISGTVKGNVIAPEQLSLKAQSRIDGSITTSTLIIESGAALNGTCAMAIS
jgi:cytoskeletal protein CcmA (bactofilin family)